MSSLFFTCKSRSWNSRSICPSTYLSILLFHSQLTQTVHACSIMSHFLQPHGLQPARLLCPWDFPGKNTRVGCHFLVQGIFLTQGSDPMHLRHQQADSLPLHHLEALTQISLFICSVITVQIYCQQINQVRKQTKFPKLFSWANSSPPPTAPRRRGYKNRR